MSLRERTHRGPVAGVVDRWPQTIAAWCGPAATVFAILGMVVVGGYVPATDPTDSGRQIADWYSENTTGIRVGMVLSMIGFSLFVPFGVAIAIQTRRAERRGVLSTIQVASVAIAALEGVISCVIWVAAAYRPDVIDPDITRALHDLGWMAFLFDVPPFGIWLVAVGVAILRDPQERLPRWLGYFNIFTALAVEPAFMIAFFKDGPFAYNGLLSLYMPFGLFFFWIVLMTPFLLRAIRRDVA